LAVALGLDIDSPQGKGYNVLQNNGRIAHQEVDHVHFHLIPKVDEKSGLIVGWPAENAKMTELGEFAKELQEKLAN
jgi:diadenosine tetraphosphate (Ap4A) HIT family hydrolase